MQFKSVYSTVRENYLILHRFPCFIEFKTVAYVVETNPKNLLKFKFL